MRSWSTTIDAERKYRAMPDPRYAVGPPPGYRQPPPPPARAARRRQYAAQIRADLAARGFAPEPQCARDGCGHKRHGHRKRLDGRWGQCQQCGTCEWYEEPNGMAHPTPPGMDTSTPGHLSTNRPGEYN